MIYSGVDLIRASGDQSERLKRLDLVEGVAAPADIDTGLDSEVGGGGGDLYQLFSELAESNSDSPEPPADDSALPPSADAEPDTQGALMRFAKFIKGEVGGGAAPKPKLRLVRGVPPGLIKYQVQIDNPSGQPLTGTMLDIRV